MFQFVIGLGEFSTNSIRNSSGTSGGQMDGLAVSKLPGGTMAWINRSETLLRKQFLERGILGIGHVLSENDTLALPTSVI
jgi:hypothetical protein